MNRPALATAGTLFGLALLLGGKAATAPSSLALAHSSSQPSTVRSGTATGSDVSTPYGPVQVEVVVAGGHITDVRALRLPSGGKSGSIADYSVPILRQEAMAAQGADIQAVSGATYTSQGYADSLQAALDQLSASTRTRSLSSAGSA